VSSIDEALEWVKKSPMPAGPEVEIRPLYSLEDITRSETSDND